VLCAPLPGWASLLLSLFTLSFTTSWGEKIKHKLIKTTGTMLWQVRNLAFIEQYNIDEYAGGGYLPAKVEQLFCLKNAEYHQNSCHSKTLITFWALFHLNQKTKELCRSLQTPTSWIAYTVLKNWKISSPWQNLCAPSSPEPPPPSCGRA